MIARLEAQGAQDLVRPGRVLDQQDRGRLASDRDRLHAPEHRLDPGQRAHGLLEADSEPQRRGDRGERVVDVVEARQGQLEPCLAVGGRDQRPRASHAEELDLRRRDLGRRSVGAAVRAFVVAQMADEGAGVGVRMPAAAAVLGVVGVLELGQRLRAVLDPEVGDARAKPELAIAAQVGDQRVVGVEDEAAATGPLGDHRRPFVGQVLELAVAVELVTKQIAEHDQPRIERGRHLRQPRFVDLEQALAAALFEQRRGHAPAHVRPGAVVDGVAAGGAHRRGQHAGGGGLAVGGADDRRAADELAAEARDRVRRDPQQQPAGQRGAAATAAAAAERARCPRQRDLGPEHAAACAHPGTMTLSARGSTRNVAGRSAWWSPSA